MESISSLKNPKAALWRSLKERKGRRESGCFLVEGDKMVLEAFRSCFPVEAVLIREDRGEEDFPIPDGIPVFVLSRSVFDSVSDTRTPQGIAAVLRITGRELCGRRLIALDGVQDPGNVGTIIRTADAAGFDGILLSAECADVFSPKVLRATMGSIYRMPLRTVSSLLDELRKLRESGYSVLSSQLDGDPFYERKNVADDFCLIIGNEGNGISEEVRAEATHRLKLPMRGGAESLNAAVAAAIMMYELTRPCPATGA